MSSLARLREREISRKAPTPEPTKPTKLGFDGFEGTPPPAFRNIQGSEAEVARLYELLALRWEYPPGSWEADRPTILSDPLNALACLRGLVADQIEENPAAAPQPQGD